MLNKVKNLSRNSDLAIAFGLILTLGLMIVPVNPFFMDLFIASVLAGSIAILLISVYIKKPLSL